MIKIPTTSIIAVALCGAFCSVLISTPTRPTIRKPRTVQHPVVKDSFTTAIDSVIKPGQLPAIAEQENAPQGEEVAYFESPKFKAQARRWHIKPAELEEFIVRFEMEGLR